MLIEYVSRATLPFLNSVVSAVFKYTFEYLFQLFNIENSQRLLKLQLYHKRCLPHSSAPIRRVLLSNKAAMYVTLSLMQYEVI